jgi:hypothetical protein
MKPIQSIPAGHAYSRERLSSTIDVLEYPPPSDKAAPEVRCAAAIGSPHAAAAS